MLYLVLFLFLLSALSAPVKFKATSREAHQLLHKASLDAGSGIRRTHELGVFEGESEHIGRLVREEQVKPYGARWHPDFKPTPRKLGYSSQASMIGVLKKMDEDLPHTVHYHKLGESVRGQEIGGVLFSRCTNRLQGCPDRPTVALMGPVHGDEVVGRELLFLLAKFLAEYDGTSVNATNLIDRVNLWVVPQLNPDGMDDLVRVNAKGHDLNRASQDRCGQAGQPAAEVPEVVAAQQFIMAVQPVGALWMHGGEEVISYPYDSNCTTISTPEGYPHAFTPTADQPVVVDFARAYASKNPRMVDGIFLDGVTNGADWYVLFGGLQDWAYLNSPRTVISLTAEVSEEKTPPRDDVLRLYNPANREALIHFASNFVSHSIHGHITHQVTRHPIAGASVYIRPHTEGHGPVSATTKFGLKVETDEFGWFHRPAVPGSYELIVTAPGYAGQRVHVDLAETDASGKMVEFQMQ